MADNVTLNAGTGGAVVATDDIGGVQHQRVKVGHGVDGSYSDVSALAPLPVEALELDDLLHRLLDAVGMLGQAFSASAALRVDLEPSDTLGTVTTVGTVSTVSTVTGVTTVTTVSTVTNQAQMGGMPATLDQFYPGLAVERAQRTALS